MLAQISRLISGLIKRFGGETNVQLLSAEQANEQSQAGLLTLVDIRSPQEWQQTGIAKTAVAISMQQPSFLQDVLELVEQDRTRPLAVICATGSRSSWVARQLSGQGFTAIYNVGEGMMGGFTGPGWLRKQLPTRKA